MIFVIGSSCRFRSGGRGLVALAILQFAVGPGGCSRGAERQEPAPAPTSEQSPEQTSLAAIEASVESDAERERVKARATAHAGSPGGESSVAGPETSEAAPVKQPSKASAPKSKGQNTPRVNSPPKGTASSAAETPPPAASSVAAAPTASSAPPSKVYTGDKPCRASNFKFASVRQACSRGGVLKAKRLMKYIVKKAKGEGKRFKCSSCHDNTKTYTNKPNAAADLRPWL